MSKIKMVSLRAKCSDCCMVSIFDDTGEQIGEEHVGYVPSFIPNEWGDYVDLEIDNETGKILNWVPLDNEAVFQFFGVKEED